MFELTDVINFHMCVSSDYAIVVILQSISARRATGMFVLLTNEITYLNFLLLFYNY